MARRKRKYATNPHIRKEQIAHWRDLNGPQNINGRDDPTFAAGGHSATARHHKRQLVLYATALGRQRGELPAALGAWSAFPVRLDDGKAVVWFTSPQGDKVRVDLRNLDAWPPQPIEDIDGATALAA